MWTETQTFPVALFFLAFFGVQANKFEAYKTMSTETVICLIWTYLIDIYFQYDRGSLIVQIQAWQLNK